MAWLLGVADKVAGQQPGDARRRATRLLEAQRWREAVRAEATPPDDLLRRAVEGLAGQLRQVWKFIIALAASVLRGYMCGACVHAQCIKKLGRRQSSVFQRHRAYGCAAVACRTGAQRRRR